MPIGEVLDIVRGTARLYYTDKLKISLVHTYDPRDAATKWRGGDKDDVVKV